jgi:hypothetical protein
MPAEFKTGTAINYDVNQMMGNYTENGTGAQLVFEGSKPNINIVPGDLVEVLYRTPSGREINVVVKINGRDI